MKEKTGLNWLMIFSWGLCNEASGSNEDGEFSSPDQLSASQGGFCSVELYLIKI
jgi:hypothetical protein